MDVVIRCWDESNNVTQTRYLDSMFLNQPYAEELLSSICESLTNLREDKLLHLSVDGPAVNWKVLKLFDKKLESKDLPKTLNIGACSKHSVHGALKMGMKSVDWNVENILKSMFWILHDSPAKKGDYMREGQTTVFSLRYLYYFQISIKCILRAYFRKIKRPGIRRFVVKYLFQKRVFS